MRLTYHHASRSVSAQHCTERKTNRTQCIHVYSYATKCRRFVATTTIIRIVIALSEALTLFVLFAHRISVCLDGCSQEYCGRISVASIVLPSQLRISSGAMGLSTNILLIFYS